MKRQEALRTEGSKGTKVTNQNPELCNQPPVTSIHHLAFTPKALNSKAQRRVAHAGLPIIHMIEPQRGSTNIPQNPN